MPDLDKVIAVAREWIAKAENDLKAAAYMLEMDDECPADTVGFHAQQCVEKYLKAFLVLKNIDFPKTHDIGNILTLFPDDVRMSLSMEEQRTLTNYATVTRYPGDYEPVTLSEAKRAVRIARRVRRQIRKVLPMAVLSRRRK
ncbi:MAG: HEPN domain-containing protein [Anaerolineales bacterium]|nr:HEPN domain-containing protein [Anaerolineales bacterium]